MYGGLGERHVENVKDIYIKRRCESCRKSQITKKVSTSSSQIKQDAMGANFASQAFHERTPQSSGDAGEENHVPLQALFNLATCKEVNSSVTFLFLQHLHLPTFCYISGCSL